MIEYLAQHLWQMWAVVAVICLILELTAGVVEVDNLVNTLFHILYVLDFEAFDSLLFVIT